MCNFLSFNKWWDLLDYQQVGSDRLSTGLIIKCESNRCESNNIVLGSVKVANFVSYVLKHHNLIDPIPSYNSNLVM